MAQPGWYPDPYGNPSIHRYFDGAAWTARTQPSGPAAGVAGATPPAESAPAAQPPSSGPPAKARVNPIVWVIGAVIGGLVIVGLVATMLLLTNPKPTTTSSPSARVTVAAPVTSSSSASTGSASASASTGSAALPVAAPTVPCPTLVTPDGRVTDGYLTYAPPAGWTQGGRPSWTTCGTTVELKGSSGVWRAVIAQGIVGNPTNSLQDVATSLWQFAVTHYYDPTITTAEFVEGNMSNLNGQPGASVNGLVHARDGNFDVVRIVVVQRPDWDVSVMITAYTAADGTSGASIKAAMESATNQ